jgi:DNA-binding response OmpR family regulator
MTRTPVELEKAGARDASHPVTGVADARTPKNILIVDDNEDILFFMRAALEQAGYEVQTASDGAQAFAQQMQHRADLLITDIFMPGRDGIETLRDSKTRFPQTRVIVMSAGGGTGGQLDYLSAAALIGANATLRKPFSLDELLDTVQKVLQL